MRRFFRSALSDLTHAARRLTDGHDPGLRILTYHRVTDAHPRERLCVPVSRFEEQMRRLRERGYQTISLAQAVDWLTGQRQATSDKRQVIGDGRQETRSASQVPGPMSHAPSAVLTFDDGYEDNFRYAAPAMERYGFTGIFFVPSGFIEDGESHPLDDRPMTWEHLCELLRRGHEIGGHSVSHRRLASLEAIEMFWEVRGCKETLEQALRHPVEAFCYPSGDYNEMVKRAVMRSGYRAACTVEPGANIPGADPLALKRTEISGFDSLWDFEKKLAGAYNWLHRSVQRMKSSQGAIHESL